jgi:hypothetical protein
MNAIRRLSTLTLALACAWVSSVVLRPSWQDWQFSAHLAETPAVRALAAPVSHFSFTTLLAQGFAAVQTGVASAFGKQEAALSQLLQGKLNFAGLLKTQDRAGASRNTYAAATQGACESLEGGINTGNANVDSALMAKGMTTAKLAQVAGVQNASQAAQVRLMEFTTSYCSNYAATRGRCTKTATNMQDADVNFSTVVVPSSTDTHSFEEQKAASAYIDNVTAPISAEALPLGMERTPHGVSMAQVERQYMARMSMAQHSLANMLTVRQPRN